MTQDRAIWLALAATFGVTTLLILAFDIDGFDLGPVTVPLWVVAIAATVVLVALNDWRNRRTD